MKLPGEAGERGPGNEGGGAVGAEAAAVEGQPDAGVGDVDAGGERPSGLIGRERHDWACDEDRCRILNAHSSADGSWPS